MVRVDRFLISSIVAVGIGCGSKGPVAVVDQKSFRIAPKVTSTPTPASEHRVEFVIRNEGGEALKLTPSFPSCGCAKAWLESDTVEPGKSVRVFASILACEFGATSLFPIRTNDPANPNLDLDVAVEPSVAPPCLATPEPTFTFLTLRAGTTAAATISCFEPRESSRPWLSAVTSKYGKLRPTLRQEGEFQPAKQEWIGRVYAVEVALIDGRPRHDVDLLEFRDRNGRVVAACRAEFAATASVVASPELILVSKKDGFPFKRRIFFQYHVDVPRKYSVATTSSDVTASLLPSRNSSIQTVDIEIRRFGVRGRQDFIDFSTGLAELPTVRVAIRCIE